MQITPSGSAERKAWWPTPSGIAWGRTGACLCCVSWLTDVCIVPVSTHTYTRRGLFEPLHTILYRKTAHNCNHRTRTHPPPLVHIPTQLSPPRPAPRRATGRPRCAQPPPTGNRRPDARGRRGLLGGWVRRPVCVAVCAVVPLFWWWKMFSVLTTRFKVVGRLPDFQLIN